MISGMPDHRLRKVIGAVALVLAVLQLVFNAYIPRRWFALALIAISGAGSLKLLLT